MDAHFWHARWREERIGFHEGVTNRHLEQYWPALGLQPGSSVLVPLCGKAVDLATLHRMGHHVVGVELSEIACRAFFDEQALPFDVQTHGEHDIYRGVDAGAGLSIWCGDFTTADFETPMDAVFDRAALIALGPEEREVYIKHIANHLKPGAPGLLVSIDYPASEKAGPPFTIPQEDVDALLSESFDLKKLSDEDVLLRERADKRWGLTALREQVYRIKKH
jgi:thiopurine S-methyltransferase